MNKDIINEFEGNFEKEKVNKNLINSTINNSEMSKSGSKSNILIRIKSILKSKVLVQIYFVFFIFLNIIDFYGISGDLDFFKKILSWILIGNLFYHASPTKIFIGKRNKLYDVLLILSFSLMTILKSIILYLSNYNANNYPIFSIILTPIYDYNKGISIITTGFFIGIISVITISILLLNKYKPSKESLIGSFKLNEYLKFIKLDYILLILFNIFFTITIFNLFMEWFAIAVDSIILVLGVIYYLYRFIKEHSNINSKYLSVVSNTGNEFFENLIKTFSNKNTILIGISFIMTLHLLVDAGAYLVPYSIGTGSSLYFNSLNIGGTDHTPLFNFKEISNSQIIYDTKLIMSSNMNSNFIGSILYIIEIIFIDLLSLYLFFFLLISPFYIFYKNINKEKIKFNKIISIIFLISLISFLVLNLLNDNSSLVNSNSNDNILNFVTIPLGIENINKITHISGVDIYTNPLIRNSNSLMFIQISIIISIISLILLFKYFSKYELFFQRIILFSIFIFFLIYISIFSISRLSLDYKLLNEDNVDMDNLKLINEYISNIDLKIPIRNKFILNNGEIVELEILIDNSGMDNETNNNYKSKTYILIKISNSSDSNQLVLNRNIKLILDEEVPKEYTNNKYLFFFGDENNLDVSLLYLGENIVNSNESIKDITSRISINDLNKDNSFLTLKFDDELVFNLKPEINYQLKQSLIKEVITKKSKEGVRNISGYVELIFTSIFYLFGIIFYSFYYIRFNLNYFKEVNNENYISNLDKDGKKYGEDNCENKSESLSEKVQINPELEKRFKYFK